MMQPLPPQLELPEGDRFTLPTVSAVRELVPPGGQLPAHMVLMMICGKELWVPLDRGIARQMANILWFTFPAMEPEASNTIMASSRHGGGFGSSA
jgi:hypothetical protein